jgi:hypothetical protein
VKQAAEEPPRLKEMFRFQAAIFALIAEAAPRALEIKAANGCYNIKLRAFLARKPSSHA